MQTSACNIGTVALQADVRVYRQQYHLFMSLGHLPTVKWIGNEQGMNRGCTGDADRGCTGDANRGCKQGMLNRDANRGC